MATRKPKVKESVVYNSEQAPRWWPTSLMRWSIKARPYGNEGLSVERDDNGTYVLFTDVMSERRAAYEQSPSMVEVRALELKISRQQNWLNDKDRDIAKLETSIALKKPTEVRQLAEDLRDQLNLARAKADLAEQIANATAAKYRKLLALFTLNSKATENILAVIQDKEPPHTDLVKLGEALSEEHILFDGNSPEDLKNRGLNGMA